jgi:hypothetical protein
MPDKSHFIPEKFHFMHDPTGQLVAADRFAALLNEYSFSIMGASGPEVLGTRTRAPK